MNTSLMQDEVANALLEQVKLGAAGLRSVETCVHIEACWHWSDKEMRSHFSGLATPSEKMIWMTKGIVSHWPCRPDQRWQRICAHLTPLAEILRILDSEAVSDCVKVHPNPCIMNDVRMDLAQFKLFLDQRLMSLSE